MPKASTSRSSIARSSLRNQVAVESARLGQGWLQLFSFGARQSPQFRHPMAVADEVLDDISRSTSSAE